VNIETAEAILESIGAVCLVLVVSAVLLMVTGVMVMACFKLAALTYAWAL
jgi:hypothetical protein